MKKVKISSRDSLGRIPKIWTIEKALLEAKKYKTKKEFRTNSNSAYQYLVKHKMINCLIMDGKRHRVSYWDIFCSLKKSTTWSEFRYEYPKEYSAFHKRKKLLPSSAYSHLGVSKTSKRWDKASIMEEAIKYNHRSQFSSNASGAYDAALSLKIIDDVCSHMEPLNSDFDCVYMWTAKIIRGKRLVKYGVTSRRLGLARISFVESKSRLKAEEVFIKYSDESLVIEKTLKEIGIKACMPTFSGSTEFYWLDEKDFKLAKWVLNNEAIK